MTRSWISANSSSVPLPLMRTVVFRPSYPGGYLDIDAQKAAQVDLARGLDLEGFDLDSFQRRQRHIADRHAGVERSNQVLLRVGELIGAAKLVGLVDVEGELPLDVFPRHLESLDMRAALSLSLPAVGHPPAGLAIGRVVPHAVDEGFQVVHVDAVDDTGFVCFRKCSHCLCLSEGLSESVLPSAQRVDGSHDPAGLIIGDQPCQDLEEVRVAGAGKDVLVAVCRQETRLD